MLLEAFIILIIGFFVSCAVLFSGSNKSTYVNQNIVYYKDYIIDKDSTLTFNKHIDLKV